MMIVTTSINRSLSLNLNGFILLDIVFIFKVLKSIANCVTVRCTLN
jgi:hypothetical protein